MMDQLSWQTCSVCGIEFRGAPRRIGKNVFCSRECSNSGKRSTLRAASVFGVWELTDLNVTVSAFHDACVAAGTHKPGRKVTTPRTYKGLDERMPICRTCGVPFPGRGAIFSLRGSWGLDDEDAA